MQIHDVFPRKAFFKPGEVAELIAHIDSELDGEYSYHLTISQIAETVYDEQGTLRLHKGEQEVKFSWSPPEEGVKGYGVHLELMDGNGQIIDARSSAFDVLNEWTDYPRYGFLSDFPPDRANVSETMDVLRRLHINGLQFYDWQFRHDQLIAPTREYEDPLGRTLSLDIVTKLIEGAHQVGIAAMPYLAVYAASVEFWQSHPEWALYDKNGETISFEGFLGLMDPSPDSPWTKHLLMECQKILTEFPFDGLHVDQYGEPKLGFRESGEPVDIPAAFHHFIAELKSRHNEPSVTFNAVGNWPIEALASSEQDFEYIEVWPPTPHYKDLWEIVSGARKLSGNRPVVIALYLPADNLSNILLADALILAAGGVRIEIGEGGRLLTDPYFPKHQAIDNTLMAVLRNYYDFAVRYGELNGPIADEITMSLETPNEVWAIPRKSANGIAINLINFSGIQDTLWTEVLEPPEKLYDFQIKINGIDAASKVWWASPDNEELSLMPAEWQHEGNNLAVEIPKLNYWSMLFIEA